MLPRPIALALALAPAPAAADTLKAFLKAHRCPVIDRLARIHEAGDPSTSRDRFLVVALKGRPQAYVQCILYEQDTRRHCEASSGFYASKPGEPRAVRLGAEGLAGLGNLGFTTYDRGGNLVRDLDLGSAPDLPAAADLILTALHEGYGARADDALEITAPFARTRRLRPLRCEPVS